MATLHPPFDKLTPGTHSIQIWAILKWANVGTCNITENSGFTFAANGNYNALGHSGTFNLVAVLTDSDPTSATGPCSITSNGQTSTATYSRNGDSITFAADHGNIVCSPDPSGVVFQVSGYPKARILA